MAEKFAYNSAEADALINDWKNLASNIREYSGIILAHISNNSTWKGTEQRTFHERYEELNKKVMEHTDQVSDFADELKERYVAFETDTQEQTNEAASLFQGGGGASKGAFSIH